MNKRRLSQASLLRLPICFFQGREKAKWFRLPICFFPGLEKAKRLRLPICFFPAREKAKLFQISNLLFPNPGKSNRKSEEQLFLQRGQVTNMTCADLSQDLREPFATAVRAHSKSAFEIRSLTRKRWVFERRSCEAFCLTTGNDGHLVHRVMMRQQRSDDGMASQRKRTPMDETCWCRLYSIDLCWILLVFSSKYVS